MTGADGDRAIYVPTFGVKILYIHVGFVSPELFVHVVKQADLPIILEGQHTASVVATLGKAYIKLQDSVLNCPSQVLRIPNDIHRHSDVIDRITKCCLTLQHGALGKIDLRQSVDCVAGLVAKCIDPHSHMNIYLNDLKSYYQNRGADKFEILLSAWNKFGCLNPPERTKSTDFRSIPRKYTPRMMEEIDLDIETTKKMLSEFSRIDGPLSEDVM